MSKTTSNNENNKAQVRTGLQWLFSPTLLKKNVSHKIAYIAIMTAFCVVANMLEIKLGGVQFSFTIVISAFAGLVLGGGAGFCACFLGDMIGFFLHPFGEYSPWIGISTGCMALFVGLVLYMFGSPQNRIYWKLSVACLSIFLVCTCGITTVYLHIVWFKNMSFLECLTYRLFVQGQFYNSLVNSAIVVIGMPWIAKRKALRLEF